MGSQAYPALLMVPVSKLLRNELAPRRRNAETVHLVGQSLKLFGILSPPVWNVRSGRILARHSLVEAQRDAGAEKIAVWAVDLDEGKEAAAVLALDSHLNEWDWEHVAADLGRVKAAGIDLAMTFMPPSDTGPLTAADWKPAAKAPLDDVHADVAQGGLFG